MACLLVHSCSVPEIDSSIIDECSDSHLTLADAAPPKLEYIDVYVDGSASMQGYVGQSTSIYAKLLPELEDQFRFSVQGANTKFYRLGKPVNTSISDCYALIASNNPCKVRIDDLSAAGDTEFYIGGSQKWPQLTSSIELAIPLLPEDSATLEEYVKQSRLSLIITDLEPDDAAVDTLSLALKPYFYSNEDFAVGILAVRSGFNGPVFYIKSTEQIERKQLEQLSTNEKSRFQYSTNGEGQEQGRPFYILMIGNRQHVENYIFSVAEQVRGLMAPVEGSIFTSSKVVSKYKFVTGTPSSLEGVRKVESINDGKARLYKEEGVEVFSAQKDSEKGSISYEALPVFLDDFYLSPSSEGLKAINSTVSTLNSDQMRSTEPGFSEDVSFTDFSVSNQKGGQSQPTFSFSSNVLFDDWEPKAIHLIEADLISSSLKEADWWEQFDWSTANDFKDGSKTYNISRFLNQLLNLAESSTPDENSIVGKVCFGVLTK